MFQKLAGRTVQGEEAETGTLVERERGIKSARATKTEVPGARTGARTGKAGVGVEAEARRVVGNAVSRTGTARGLPSRTGVAARRLCHQQMRLRQ